LLRDRSILRAPILATLVVGAAAISACGPAADPQLQPASTELPPTALTPQPSEEAESHTTSSETLTLQGWLSIVWNDEPHFFLTRDDGRTVEVLLDEQLTQPLGGPLALDRTRVVILAVVNPESPDVFQALSIEIEAGG
jgi:hypothetical protein